MHFQCANFDFRYFDCARAGVKIAHLEVGMTQKNINQWKVWAAPDAIAHRQPKGMW